MRPLQGRFINTALKTIGASPYPIICRPYRACHACVAPACHDLRGLCRACVAPACHDLRGLCRACVAPYRGQARRAAGHILTIASKTFANKSKCTEPPHQMPPFCLIFARRNRLTRRKTEHGTSLPVRRACATLRSTGMRYRPFTQAHNNKTHQIRQNLFVFCI